MATGERGDDTAGAGDVRAPVVVYPSAWKLLMWAAVWGGAEAALVWAMLRGLLDVIPFVLLFAAAILYALYRLLRRSPMLMIDDQGIYHDVLGLRPQRIDWAEIGSIGRCRMKTPTVGLFTLTYLAITPNDEEAFLARQTGMLRWLLRRYMASSPAPIMIPQHLLPVSVAWIMRQLDTRYTPPLLKGQIWDDDALAKGRKRGR
ncbi:MAG TPA: STM3941 family protein [Ktedonobacterales bacterium]|nr:STM3941 family protein [Ktedonobacterales bacterium]